MFDWERHAFDLLRDKQGIVQYLGHYSWDKDPNDKNFSPSHNILLEYGDADLEVLFASEDTRPPLRTSEIIDFWRSLFKIAEALRWIQELGHQQDGGTNLNHGYLYNMAAG